MALSPWKHFILSRLQAILRPWRVAVKVYTTGAVDMTPKAAYIVGRTTKGGR
jgi:hypothetical protein